MNRQEAIQNVFTPLLRNVVNSPTLTKYRTIREENLLIRKAFAALALPCYAQQDATWCQIRIEEEPVDGLATRETETYSLKDGHEGKADVENSSKKGSSSTSSSSSPHRLSLNACDANELLFACGFSRGSQISATTGAEEAVWTLRYKGEEDEVNASLNHAKGAAAQDSTVRRLESILKAFERYLQLSASPASSSSSSKTGEPITHHNSNTNSSGSGVTMAPSSVVSARKCDGKEEIDLNQVKRLKELRAARHQQQQPPAASSSPATDASKHFPSSSSSSEKVNSQSDPKAIIVDETAMDFLAVQHLVDKVKLTIHKTGRLRNYSFEARDFTLRRMTHGRMAHLCADDRCLQRGQWAPKEEEVAADKDREEKERAAFLPLLSKGTLLNGGSNHSLSALIVNVGGDSSGSISSAISAPILPEIEGEEERGHCLEAHWHVRNANIIYSYVAHLSPSGSRVLHMGEEFGYQYNSLPGTEHFGKTILLTVKKVNMETNRLESMKHPNKPSEKCAVCGVAFSKLWL